MKRVIHLDYETFSTVDIRKSGAYKYAMHHSTEILMLGWAIGDDEPSVWEPHINPEPPKKLIDALRDPNVVKKAFNANFERLITKYVLKVDVPIEQWQCVMVKAFYLSFTGGLGRVLDAVGLPEKDKRGGSLINLFCTPAPKNHHADRYDWTNRPNEWEEFKSYCYTDVVTERNLDHWLDKYPGMHEWDWVQWHLDQTINDRGVELDVDMAESAVEIWQKETDSLKAKLAEVTGLSRITRGPFIGWLNLHLPEPILTTTKDELNSLLRSGVTAPVDTAIELWLQKEAKATSKYLAVCNVACADRRARGLFQYKGAARTDRVGGRLIQLQNLKRPFLDDTSQITPLVELIKCKDPALLQGIYGRPVADILGGSIRHAVKARVGCTLAIADLSSIESVVLGWVAMCPLIDSTFRGGRDSYKVFATKYYDIPYDEVTKAQRGFSKPPVLGCGYMLGWRGLIAYAEGYGVDMSKDDAQRAVDTFRGMYPEIPAFWKWIDQAVKYVTATGVSLEGYRMVIERDDDFLRIRLPSGRNLSYYKPDVITKPAPWDPEKTVDNFAFMGMNERNQWTQLTAHAGLLTENIVQSLAGDILWNGIVNASQCGLDVVLHVHDEIAVETPKEDAGAALATLVECMTMKPTWAQDMWLGADGFITERYTKD